MNYLFKFERKDCQGMPNTNNLIEGLFSDLKKNVNVHSGMCKESRKRFILWYFEALKIARLHSSSQKPQAVFVSFSWHGKSKIECVSK